MKLSILSTFSVIACAFIGFVSASPMDSTSLVARDATSDTLISIITGAKTDLDTCHAKWKGICATACTVDKISSWGNECASIVITATTKCKAAIPVGWVFPDPTAFVLLLVAIIKAICDTLTILLTYCNLLGILISVLLILIGGLQALVTALIDLLNCLGVCIPGLLGLITAALGGITCLILSLLGL